MSSYRVVVPPVVEDDVVALYEYIAARSPDNAARWIEEIERAIHSLSDLPKRCPLAPESNEFSQEIRQLIYGNYRILFLIEGREVHVLHVRHSGRAPLGGQPE